MEVPREDRAPIAYTVLSAKAIWLAFAAILVTGAAVAVWLLLAYGRGDTQERNQLEAIKTAGTVVLGTGGAAALLLAARRQRAAEIALTQKDSEQRHQERIATATEADAAARRITDLFAKAVEQLGSDKAPVRMGGFYALERLAQDVPEQRQTIVNVVCAYLRLEARPDSGEDEVRKTALEILTIHLQKEREPELFWPDIDLNLIRARIELAHFGGCHIRWAKFEHATLRDAFFGGAHIEHGWFKHCTFEDRASFKDATLTTGSFPWARFTGHARFDHVTFGARCWFQETVFAGTVSFDGASFPEGARFDDVEFAGTVSHDGVILPGGVDWDEFRAS